METLSIDLNDQHTPYLDAAGNLAMISNHQACLQNCQTAMLAQRAEMYYAMDEGIPYRQTSWDRYRPAQFEAATRVAILSVPGVIRIESFSFGFTDNRFHYTATIVTNWGKGEIKHG